MNPVTLEQRRQAQTHVGDSVRQIREGLGKSRRDVVEAVTQAGIPGWHGTTLQRVENGERALRITEAVVLAAYLGVDLAPLLPRFTAPVTPILEEQARTLLENLSQHFASKQGASDV